MIEPTSEPTPEPLFTPRFISLWLFSFVTFFSAFQLLPAIPFRIIELGGSTALAGSFLFVYTAASALAAPVMGTIADQVGRRRALITASILFIAFSIAYGVIADLPLLLVIGIVHGAIWSSILSSASAIMSEYIPASRRTQGLAYWGIAATAAIAVAPAVGLFVRQYGWLTLCLELAAISVVMAIWASRLAVVDMPRPSSLPDIRDAWDWRVIRAALSLAVTSFGYGGITSYVAILSLQRGLKPEWLYFAVYCGAIVLMRIFFSHLGDRYGIAKVLYPCLAAIPLSFLLLAVAKTHAMLIASAILFGIGLGGAFPVFMNFIVSNTDERRRARTFGSVVLAFDLGIGIGSLTIGILGHRYGLGRAFMVAAAISCLAIPIFRHASRQMANGTAVAGEPEHAGTG